jgi:hypothetical protein
MSRSFSLLGLVAILPALALLPACNRSRQDAEIQQIGLAHAAEVSGLCAAVLEALDRNEPEKVRELLALNLRESVLHAEGLVAVGARIEQPMPGIRAGMARAGAYAAQHDPRVADAAKRVLGVLGPDPAAGTQ